MNLFKLTTICCFTFLRLKIHWVCGNWQFYSKSLSVIWLYFLFTISSQNRAISCYYQTVSKSFQFSFNRKHHFLFSNKNFAKDERNLELGKFHYVHWNPDFGLESRIFHSWPGYDINIHEPWVTVMKPTSGQQSKKNIYILVYFMTMKFYIWCCSFGCSIICKFHC